MKTETPLGVLTKRLRATITIEIEASDYREAAEHQACLETHLSAVRGDYPEARIVLSERRGGPRGGDGTRPLYRRSGRLHTYD